eukprot:6211416-Pyramimonas_sp.AAC.1
MPIQWPLRSWSDFGAVGYDVMSSACVGVEAAQYHFACCHASRLQKLSNWSRRVDFRGVITQRGKTH